MDPQKQAEIPPPYYDGPAGPPQTQGFGPPQTQGFGPPAPGTVPPPAPFQVGMPPTVGFNPAILGEFSMAMACNHCHGNIQTRISHRPGLLTYLAAGGICLFGGFFGCCLIPFCLDFCLDVVHSCPNCNHVIGVYQRLK